MADFESWRSYWDFARAVRWRTRYVHSPEIRKFMDSVRETSRKRVQEVPDGRIVWRAQLGNDWEPLKEIDDVVPAPYSPERMIPSSGQAREGRANPKGIPYLYTATLRDTALAEVRPWVGSHISVAQFKLTRAVRIVSCTSKREFFVYFSEPEPDAREESVWVDIDRAFSEPVAPNDEHADYVPTQILAEVFKSEGLDGIAYRSALGAGYNVVFFDLKVAELVNCFLFEAKKIHFEFSQSANPYFVGKHYDQSDEKEPAEAPLQKPDGDKQ